MELAVYFLLATVISFVGSMQPGPVNMAVLYQATHKQYRSALHTAIGGSIPEFIFSLVAIKFFAFINGHIQFINQFSIGLDFIFVLIGIRLMMMKKIKSNPKFFTTQQGFLSGFLVASFNPQLIIFWLGITTSLAIQNVKIETLGAQLFFSLGTTMGAFLLHLLLLLAIKNNPNHKWVTIFKENNLKIIGTLLLLIGSINFISNF